MHLAHLIYSRAHARVGSALEHTFSLAQKVGNDLHYPPMEMVPLDTMEPMEDNSYLSDRAIFARDKQIERRLRRPTKRESLQEQLDACFELVGGVPRMSIWADENPGDFYALRARVALATQAKKIDHTIQVIQPAIPMTALDGEGHADDSVEATFTDVSPSQD